MWMDLKGNILSDKSQMEKDTYCTVAHVESKSKNKTEQSDSKKQRVEKGCQELGVGQWGKVDKNV